MKTNAVSFGSKQNSAMFKDDEVVARLLLGATKADADRKRETKEMTRIIVGMNGYVLNKMVMLLFWCLGLLWVVH